MDDITRRIVSRDLKVVVIGLGYVGLPLLLLLSDLGFRAVGIDKDAKKVNKLRRGDLEFLKNNPRAKSLLIKSLKKKNFGIHQDFSEISGSTFIFITVDTPIDKKNRPDQTNISKSAQNIAQFLSKGSIVIIESTVSPGTTNEVFTPTIEKYSRLKVNVDFYVSVCSERIRPNKDVFDDMKLFPRVIGVSNAQIGIILKEMYKLITKGTIDITDILTAEIVKTVENALRDVKIAFSNEIALICERLNADIWKVRDLVNRRTGIEDMLMPGTGVGGHCLPKDPWLLVSSVNVSKQLIIPTARQINSKMPRYVAKIIKSRLLSLGIKAARAKVLILGYSYIENCDDTRNSPSIALIQQLKKIGFKKVLIHDPYAEQYNKDLYKLAHKVDCVVLVVKHDQYKNIDFSRLRKVLAQPLIIDTKNFFSRSKCEGLGLIYHSLGAPKD